MSRHRSDPDPLERQSRNLSGICDYSGWQRQPPHKQVVIHCSNDYYRYQNPVVIMGRHPADKPSALQVEINCAPGPL